MRKEIFVFAALLAVVGLLFARACGNGFVYFDDDAYITENGRVAAGLSVEGVRWALTAVKNSNWHPLTWMSHMVDVSIFGLEPWGHHLHNVLLHALNAGLVYWLLRRWGVAWAGAAVAAAFWGVHPLRVESVAWAAERKDVLSACYGFLSLLAYDVYVREGGARRWWALGFSFLLLGLGLLAKPMLVTLPCVMLVLDATIYRRLRPAAVLEKVPFFALAIGACAITVWAQRFAMQSPAALPLVQRVALAANAYMAYLMKTVWPGALTPLYPLHPAVLTLGYALLGVLVLGVITLLMLGLGSARHRAGWLIFLGTLVPVCGLVAVGNQAYADRYTYLPSLGLALILGGVLSSVRSRGLVLFATAAFAVTTWQQIGRWQDTETLFRYTLAHTTENSVAHNNLGRYLLEKGALKEGLEHVEEAVRIAPGNIQARYNLGTGYLLDGQYRKAVDTLGPLGPYYAYDANFNVNLALALHGAKDSHFSIAANNALMLLPPDAPARQKLLELLPKPPAK